MNEEQKDQKQGDEHVEILEKEGDGKEQELGLRGETGGSL